ncbi:PREDICTED: fibronectin type 3 and ankyrin repeat domains protein 1 [Thamnophis sirtalis]|uniref:Fibronectin type 3 and ankyrin repeat domains protein 1 n=1 Tax=Thamnophis sirtalis TaxID=35019 RepID=A0A6I9XUB0_9SAUR|nr:PREDICTED: fibronectin type 3 and ankyrin repeat domains protein 1 [Thamnophis sirtalis]
MILKLQCPMLIDGGIINAEGVRSSGAPALLALPPRGYARQHVVEGLEPRTTYRFRLKVTDPKGESVYSSPICVTTTNFQQFQENSTTICILIQVGPEGADKPPKEPQHSGELMAHLQNANKEMAAWNINPSIPSFHLMIACYAGHLDIVQYLRSQGASWLSRDFGGCTAMHWATDGGHCDVIEWMIQDGCEVDSRDSGVEWTPLLRLCALSGKTDVATILINAGADVNVKDKDGKTSLMVAALNNHEDLVALLLEKGADPDIKNEFGKNALDMAKGLNRQSVVSIIEEKKNQLSNSAVDLGSTPSLLFEESAS